MSVEVRKIIFPIQQVIFKQLLNINFEKGKRGKVFRWRCFDYRSHF